MRYEWPSDDMAGGAQGGDRCSGTRVPHRRPGETALIDSLSQSLAHLSVWPQPSTAPAPLGSLIVGAPHHKVTWACTSEKNVSSEAAKPRFKKTVQN